MTAGRAPALVRSHWAPNQTITLDVFGRNPLVEDARLSVPAPYAMAVREGRPPTLFADGDLPPFTASGIDPQELLKVPWYARHAVAAASDRGTVLAAVEHFAQDLDDVFRDYVHSGAQDYAQRVGAWLSGAAKTRDTTTPDAAFDSWIKQNGLG